MTGLADIQARMVVALEQAGRPKDSARLIAVSKVQPADRVQAVLDEGHRLFGENRVQEAQGRWPPFRERYDGIELHLIGPLQTNKIKPALDLFDTIQTLDRDRLARKLATEIQARGASPGLLVQINIGDEPQKAGIATDKADAFIDACRREYDLPIAGVMAIPPVDDSPRQYFQSLAEIAHRNGLAEISMGMSADFETAIAEGATMIRVGSAIFGARDPSALT
jgi:pyridoxal phosphate enzyme (YggS family)